MTIKKIVIVGGGPRGLYALESLFEALSSTVIDSNFSITIVEPTEQLGSSHVFNVYQPKTNWINISERAMTLEGRKEIEFGGLCIPGFPSYAAWNSSNLRSIESEMDTFPPRSYVGRYLQQRFYSIAEFLINSGLLTILRDRVVTIDKVGNKYNLNLISDNLNEVDEVLLAIGHQATKVSDQIKKWKNHASGHDDLCLFHKPYPIRNLLMDKSIYKDKNVALRGFGLAMIDVVRALTVGLGGTFEIVEVATRKMNYRCSGDEPNKLIPFSLDGLPIAPKPLNKEIDNLFKPSVDQEKKFRQQLKDSLNDASKISSVQFYMTPIIEIAAEIFTALHDQSNANMLNTTDIEVVIDKWLKDEKLSHELIIPRDQLPHISMQSFVDMAVGQGEISLDYCVGQVWRHLQPIMYQELAFNSLDNQIIADIVSLDERIKRYSYGCPVDSIQQLLALVRANIMKISIVDDPDIEFTKDGWYFESDDSDIKASIVINTVLDPPKVQEVDTPIIQRLLQDKIIQPVHDELGVLTDKDGCVIDAEGNKLTLALTGRLAKGTLLGTDAILECFDEPIQFWAKGVVERLRS